jgi:hypothetical protein
MNKLFLEITLPHLLILPYFPPPLPKKFGKQNSAVFLKLPWNFQKVKLLGPHQSGMWIP